MTDKILSMIKKEYRLRSLDAGVFHKLVVQGMDVAVNSFEAVDYGRVATLCASGLFGLIKRDVLIISPMEKVAPVVTYERVKAFGKDTVMLGKYDMQELKERVTKVGRKKQGKEFDAEVEAFFAAYLEEVKSAEACKVSERKEKVCELVDNLLVEGRLSSDIFLANYGVKITEKLYHQVMFGSL